MEMSKWRPVPDPLIRELARVTFTRERPASRSEAWLLAWIAEHDGAPLSRREAASWWCWGTTAARRVLVDVRAMRGTKRWAATPVTPHQGDPETRQPQEVEAGLSAASAPSTPHKHPTNTPTSRARSSLDRDRDTDIHEEGTAHTHAIASGARQPDLLSALDGDVKAVQALVSAGVTTPVELQALTLRALRALPGIGPATTKRIQAGMRRAGLPPLPAGARPKPPPDPRLRDVTDAWATAWEDTHGHGAKYPWCLGPGGADRRHSKQWISIKPHVLEEGMRRYIRAALAGRAFPFGEPPTTRWFTRDLSKWCQPHRGLNGGRGGEGAEPKGGASSDDWDELMRIAEEADAKQDALEAGHGQ